MNNKKREKVFVLISPKNRTVYNFRGELIREIIQKGYKVYATGPNLIDIERIHKLGACFIEIPNNKNGINIFSDLKYFFCLLKLFFKLKPEITLGYTVKPVIYASIAARIAGVKSVNAMITGAGYLFIAKTNKAKLLKKIVFILYSLGLKCARNIIFQNADDKKEFIVNKLVSENKCYLINGSGVNMTKFSPTDYPKKISFFMLSRIMHSKGVKEYLEAARIVKRQYQEVKFMLLGAIESIQDSIPQEFIKEYITDGTIEYYGETSDVKSYYSKCSIFVLPSYREGTPRTVLEAMSMKRPIITTDVPGCRETVIDGKTGFLIPHKDANTLADKMIFFIENKEQIPIMGEAAFGYCKEKFDVRIVNKQILSILLNQQNED
jgi:glycosyltransferase involved in cell wall biosynthesis